MNAETFEKINELPHAFLHGVLRGRVQRIEKIEQFNDPFTVYGFMANHDYSERFVHACNMAIDAGIATRITRGRMTDGTPMRYMWVTHDQFRMLDAYFSLEEL